MGGRPAVVKVNVLNDPNAMLNQKVGRQWSQSRWWGRSSQCGGLRGGKSSLLEEMFVDKRLAKIALIESNLMSTTLTRILSTNSHC